MLQTSNMDHFIMYIIRKAIKSAHDRLTKNWDFSPCFLLS